MGWLSQTICLSWLYCPQPAAPNCTLCALPVDTFCHAQGSTQDKIFALFLRIIINQNPLNPGRKLPPLFDYADLVPPPPNTRSTPNQNCLCKVCKIARKSLDYQQFASNHVNPIGMPPTNPSPKSPPPKVVPICTKCFSEVGKGKTHQCLKSTKRGNLSRIVRDTSKKSKSQITANSLKNIASDEGISTRGGTVHLKTAGKSIPVQVGQSKVKPRQPLFSHESLKRLQTANSLSDRGLM